MKTQDVMRELLKQSNLTDAQVAEGLGVSKQWVWLFKKAKMKSPSVDLMDSLHRLITGRNLLENKKHG